MFGLIRVFRASCLQTESSQCSASHRLKYILTDDQNVNRNFFSIHPTRVNDSTWCYRNYKQALVIMLQQQKSCWTEENRKHIAKVDESSGRWKVVDEMEIFDSILKLSYKEQRSIGGTVFLPLFPISQLLFSPHSPLIWITISSNEIESVKNKQHGMFYSGVFAERTFYCFTLEINLVSVPSSAILKTFHSSLNCFNVSLRSGPLW